MRWRGGGFPRLHHLVASKCGCHGVSQRVGQAAGRSAASRPRAMLVNGRAMAIDILRDVRNEVEYLRDAYGRVPGLAVIVVGDRKDSAKYVSMKRQVATSVGFHSFASELPANVHHEDVLKVIDQYNRDDR
ncbi:unnamed protein product [Phaeothamnion confervicola]